VTLLLAPAAVVLALNRATQTADYGWPPVTVSTRLFVRSAWPRLATIRPLLSDDAQAVVSAADAARFDGQYNEYLSLVPRLRAAAGGSDRLVDEISRVALTNRGAEIAVVTAGDALRYAAPMIAYPVDLVVGSRSASAWTDSRMRDGAPQSDPRLHGDRHRGPRGRSIAAADAGPRPAWGARSAHRLCGLPDGGDRAGQRRALRARQRVAERPLRTARLCVGVCRHRLGEPRRAGHRLVRLGADARRADRDAIGRSAAIDSEEGSHVVSGAERSEPRARPDSRSVAGRRP
jgi:hypothetical protein